MAKENKNTENAAGNQPQAPEVQELQEQLEAAQAENTGLKEENEKLLNFNEELQKELKAAQEDASKQPHQKFPTVSIGKDKYEIIYPRIATDKGVKTAEQIRDDKNLAKQLVEGGSNALRLKNPKK